MKKILALTFLCAIGFTSISANACPKGEHPYGGTGTHHAGGYCAP